MLMCTHTIVFHGLKKHAPRRSNAGLFEQTYGASTHFVNSQEQLQDLRKLNKSGQRKRRNHHKDIRLSFDLCLKLKRKT